MHALTSAGLTLFKKQITLYLPSKALVMYQFVWDEVHHFTSRAPILVADADGG